MAYFAKLNSDNIVVNVVKVNNNVIAIDGGEDESLGESFLNNLYQTTDTWKQTSYNNNIRGNYAGLGYTYMENVATLGVASTDIFINQQPYPSWSIGVNTASWYPPLGEPGVTTTMVANAQQWYWDEAAHQADNTVGWALTAQYGPYTGTID